MDADEDDEAIPVDVEADDLVGGLDVLAEAAEIVGDIPAVVGAPFAGGRRGRQIGDRATSAWMITLNTNRVPADDAEATAIAHQLQMAARQFLLILRDPVARWDYLTLFGADAVIDNTDFEVTVAAHAEIGPKFRRLHQHMVVVIRHRTRIKIDTGKLVQLYNRFLERFGWNIPFLHIRSFNMPIDRVMDYIRKGQWHGQRER